MTICDFFNALLHLGAHSLSNASTAEGTDGDWQSDSAKDTPSLSAILAPLPAKGL